MTEDEINENKQATVQRGFFMSLSAEFWEPFIAGGVLDEKGLLEANYTEEQLPYIREGLQELGWLPPDPKSRPGDDLTTGPLTEE